MWDINLKANKYIKRMNKYIKRQNKMKASQLGGVTSSSSGPN